ncbi:MAG: hypothetical protein H6609_17105 [Ignavibacteriales bacterium]|nr:hypothetical protein [Ignavibacteriales bacterium]
MYAVSNGENKEYSFFAPEEVHTLLKDHGKGTVATITKVAMQKGSKLVTSYKVDVKLKDVVENGAINSQTGPYLEMMIRSFEDAIKIQERFNGIANINQIAITMFIQRTKGNGFTHEQN